jgi:HAD superfamily hydrolase (TIGR01484 family)
MGIFDGCLLASDIDETLVHAGEIPQKNIDKIEWFIKEGGIFALSSGRSKEALLPILEFIDKSNIGPSAVLNGGLIYDFANETVISDSLLGEKDKLLTKYVIDNMPEVSMEVHTRDICYVPVRTEETDIHEEYEKITPVFASYEEIKDKNWLKVLFIPVTDERRAELNRIAREFCGDTSDFNDSTANIYGDVKKYIEQMPKGVSKGTAMNLLREKFGIRPGCLFGVGDYYNDLPMLREVDVPAVTADAPDDLKAIAKYITCPCRDGAVADFIDYLVKNFS